MATPDARRAVQRAQARIERIRSALAHYELMCSGTLSERMMKCGKPNCGCANDPAARHGPYYEWGRMRAGKQTHRYVSATQAQRGGFALLNTQRPEISGPAAVGCSAVWS